MKNLFEDFIKIENKFNSILKKNSKGFYPIHQLKSFSGLKPLPELIETFSDPQFYKRATHPEWNPFFQRINLIALGSNYKHYHKQYSIIRDLAESVIIFIHEIYHTILWEPFFTGSLEVKKFADYQHYSYLSEGYCFWISDIVAAQDLLIRYPNHELVLEHRAVSSINFNPWQVLKNLGVKNFKEALGIYLRAFTGNETRLLEGESPDELEMRDRFYGLHFGNQKSVKISYEELKGANVFDEFFKRFCLPFKDVAIYDFQPKSFDIESSIKYFEAFQSKLTQAIEGKSKSQLHQIAVRRKIQTAAYHAYSLLKVLSDNRTTLLKKQNRTLINHVNEYLNLLEKGIPLVKHSSKRALTQIQLANRYYSRFIKKTLHKENAYLSKFRKVLPAPLSKLVYAGKVDGKIAFGKKEINDLMDFLINISKKIHTDTLFKKYASALRHCSSLGTHCRNPQALNHVKFINLFIMSPEVVPLWSMSLAEIDPSKSNYRELLFRYD